MEDSSGVAGVVGSAIIILMVVSGVFALYRHITADPPATLQQQKTCAEQAQKDYSDSVRTGVSSYTDNYNVHLGRCYVLINDNTFSADSTSETIYESLIDAFSHEPIGTYYEIISTTKHTDVVTCTTFDSKKSSCQNSDDWNRWTAKYMQPMAKAD